jgi:formylglycine-generating enzyme required for sulfatase activity
MKATGRTPAISIPPTPTSPAAGVDLAALAMQQMQVKKDAGTRGAKLTQEGRANAAIVQRQAKQLAERTRDFATATRMLEEIDVQWRDAKLYEKMCGYRDKVMQLDATIQDAVLKGRLQFLRGPVQELLKLQPKREDMRRLLEVLPDEPELATKLTNSIGMKFVLIQPGGFMMGSNRDHSEKPLHRVQITQPFYLGVFPVTQEEYRGLVEKNPSRFTGAARLPIEKISWDDAVAFCHRLSKSPGEVQHGMRYRLPTEAEWEYACRAGSTGQWCFGDDESSLSKYAWFDKNSGGRTHPVGEKKANNWGLHDMHGNVFEWCSDRYGAYSRLATSDPQGAIEGLSRVLRGSSWRHGAHYCRSASRSMDVPKSRRTDFGFRLALSFLK